MEKSFAALSGVHKLLQNVCSREVCKINLFYKFLKAEVPNNITSELKETFDSVNKAPNYACKLALKQTIPGKQLVLKTNASFRTDGYAVMTEDNLDQKLRSKRKTSVPIAFGSKKSSPRTTNNVDLLERLLGNLHSISQVRKDFVGTLKTNDPFNGEQISQRSLSNRSYCTIFVERMQLCTAVQFHLTQRLTYSPDWN